MPIKKKTENVYRNRIDAACRYIDENLREPLCLDSVAKASQFSPYHFHRIFHSQMGETLNDYCNRRRLERAVSMLIYDQSKSVTEISLSLGFSSSANFSKSFKVYFGVTPSQVRQPDNVKNSKIGKIKSKYGKDFHPSDLYPPFNVGLLDQVEESEMERRVKVKVIDMNERTICQPSRPTNYSQNGIFNAWDRLIEWGVANGIACQDQQRFALCHDNPLITPMDKCRYDASLVIDENVVVNSPFVKSKIPAGKYAVGYYKGDATLTAKFHMGIYTEWLPSSGFEPDNYPLMERYLNDSRDDGYIELEVYIKLKALI